jgi:uncharacterized membrane protein YtjA (UPF0391 family)
MTVGATSHPEIVPTRFSLWIAATLWLTLILLLVTFFWSTRANSIFFAFTSGMFLFALLPIGIPITALVGMYYGWKGLASTSASAAKLAIALNALVLLTSGSLWLWAHFAMQGRHA